MTDVLLHNNESIPLDDSLVLTDIWLEEWEDVIFGEYNHWRDRKDIRIKYCGYQKVTENVKTGKMDIEIHLCGEPDCKFCGRKIRAEIRQAFNQHLEDGLRHIVLSGTEEEQKKQRAKIIRKYSKERVSFTVNDVITEKGWSTVVEGIIKTEDEIGEPLTEITTELVERWANKSFRHAKSGYLHKIKPPTPVTKVEPEEPPEDSTLVYAEKWLLSTKDKEILEEIQQEVRQETVNLIPQALEDIQPLR